MDAGNMIKPMLARGELRMIGATTLDEYRKHVEKDAALERRFQQVYVGEPSVEDTIGILRGLKERYEVHHGVRIQDSALVSAAVLSNRYLTNRFLPDKAIDLVDEAASASCASRSTRCRPRSTSSSAASCSSRSNRSRSRRRATPRRASASTRCTTSSPQLNVQVADMKQHWEAREAGDRRDPQPEGGARAAAHPARARDRPQRRRRDPLRPDPRARAPHRRGDRPPRRAADATSGCSRRRSTPRTSPRSCRSGPVCR